MKPWINHLLQKKPLALINHPLYKEVKLLRKNEVRGISKFAYSPPSSIQTDQRPSLYQHACPYARASRQIQFSFIKCHLFTSRIILMQGSCPSSIQLYKRLHLHRRAQSHARALSNFGLALSKATSSPTVSSSYKDLVQIQFNLVKCCLFTHGFASCRGFAFTNWHAHLKASRKFISVLSKASSSTTYSPSFRALPQN